MNHTEESISMNKNKMTDYSCPLCLERSNEVLYEYNTYAGPVLGDTTVTLVMCSSCAFVYNTPRPTHEAISRHYQESSSGAVFHEIHAGSRHSILDLERSSFIERYSDNYDSGKFIDIGCGQGSLLRKLNLPNLKKYGLDPIQNSDNDGNNPVNFINGFIETYDVNHRDKFDIVSCISSLEHFYSPDIVLDKFHEMLNPDGMLFLEIPDSLSPKSQLAEFFSFEHLSHFTEASLTKMLNLHGFEVIEFDKNVSIPNLRVVAKRAGISELKKVENNERLLLKATISNYKYSKEKIIEEMASLLEPLMADCEANNKCILIYGAGDHSVHLFSHFNLEKLVSHYIDSDPKKWGTTFRGKTVLQPNEIADMTENSIVISSHDYEDEILGTINKCNVNSLPVVRLYNAD